MCLVYLEVIGHTSGRRHTVNKIEQPHEALEEKPLARRLQMQRKDI